MIEDKLRSIFKACLEQFPDVLDEDLKINRDEYPAFYQRFKRLCDKLLAGGESFPLRYVQFDPSRIAHTVRGGQRRLAQNVLNALINEYRADHADNMRSVESDLLFGMHKDKGRELISSFVAASADADELKDYKRLLAKHVLLRRIKEGSIKSWNSYKTSAKDGETLTAPLFFKKHYSELIVDGTIDAESARALDASLMADVESYIARSRSASEGLTDAKGLNFIDTRKPFGEGVPAPHDAPMPISGALATEGWPSPPQSTDAHEGYGADTTLVATADAVDPPPQLSDQADWRAVLVAQRVPDNLHSVLTDKLRLEIARATRPKWADRLDYRELRTLTAPAFLKKVHAAEIGKDRSISKEVIRAIDPDLMKAVETYISQRNRRNGSDLGEAEGLSFVGERKPGAGRPKAPKPI